MATITTPLSTTSSKPLSTTSSKHRSRALRSAEGLIAGYVHTLATAWAPDPVEATAGPRQRERSVMRREGAALRAKSNCWTRGGRGASAFWSQTAREAC